MEDITSTCLLLYSVSTQCLAKILENIYTGKFLDYLEMSRDVLEVPRIVRLCKGVSFTFRIACDVLLHAYHDQ